ncbi:hypothetical protein, partial [Streptomyces mirabilis]
MSFTGSSKGRRRYLLPIAEAESFAQDESKVGTLVGAGKQDDPADAGQVGAAPAGEHAGEEALDDEA